MQKGKVIVLAKLIRKRLVHIGCRLFPLPPIVDGDSDRAPLVEPGRLALYQESGILYPLRAAFVPGSPDAILEIAGEADMRLEFERGGDRDRLIPAPLAESPHQNIVIARVVAVPTDIHTSQSVRRNGRLPVIGRGRRYSLCREPVLTVEAAGEDVGLRISKTLPDQPERAGGVGRDVVKNVGLRMIGQPLQRGPALAVKPPAIQIPVAVLPGRPDDPHAPSGISSDLCEKHVGWSGSDLMNSAPAASVKMPSQYFVGIIAIADPGQP